MPIGNAFAILKSVKIPVPMVETFININQPTAMVFDSNDNLFVTCSGGSWINKITPSGVMTTFTQIVTGNNSITYEVRPEFLGIDSSNNIYTTDPATSVAAGLVKYAFNIYKISPTGQMSTFYTNLGNSMGICIDKNDNLYVSDLYQINKFDLNGNRTFNFGKTLQIVPLPKPYGIAADSGGSIYFTDSSGKKTFKINNGICFEFGGGYKTPTSICVDKQNNVYITDGNIIKKFNFSSGISDFAGSSTAGDIVGTASSSRFNGIRNIVYNKDAIYIADKFNNKIKKLTL